MLITFLIDNNQNKARIKVKHNEIVNTTTLENG